MSHYLRLDLVRFLKAVDHALARPAEVVIIGGAACAIRYGVLYATRDIDTWSELSAGLSGAVARARETTGLAIPFGPAGVADGPHGFETRLVRVLPQLKRLRVRVPERHDLVLMKMVRGYEHDLEAAEAMHRRKALRLDTLLERYESEMGSVVGHPTRLRGNLLGLEPRSTPPLPVSVPSSTGLWMRPHPRT